RARCRAADDLWTLRGARPGGDPLGRRTAAPCRRDGGRDPPGPGRHLCHRSRSRQSHFRMEGSLMSPPLHCNNAAVGQLSPEAAWVMTQAIGQASQPDFYAASYPWAARGTERVRGLAGLLLGADPAHVALVESTSAGLAAI